jgi:hypothetical protein
MEYRQEYRRNAVIMTPHSRPRRLQESNLRHLPHTIAFMDDNKQPSQGPQGTRSEKSKQVLRVF